MLLAVQLSTCKKVHCLALTTTYGLVFTRVLRSPTAHDFSSSGRVAGHVSFAFNISHMPCVMWECDSFQKSSSNMVKWRPHSAAARCKAWDMQSHACDANHCGTRQFTSPPAHRDLGVTGMETKNRSTRSEEKDTFEHMNQSSRKCSKQTLWNVMLSEVIWQWCINKWHLKCWRIHFCKSTYEVREPVNIHHNARFKPHSKRQQTCQASGETSWAQHWTLEPGPARHSSCQVEGLTRLHIFHGQCCRSIQTWICNSFQYIHQGWGTIANAWVYQQLSWYLQVTNLNMIMLYMKIMKMKLKIMDHNRTKNFLFRGSASLGSPAAAFKKAGVCS